MDDDQLAQRLFAMVRDQAATDALGLGMMQSAFDSGGDPFYVIADAVSYLDPATLPTEVRAAYVAYRAAVTDPTWLTVLPELT